MALKKKKSNRRKAPGRKKVKKAIKKSKKIIKKKSTKISKKTTKKASTRKSKASTRKGSAKRKAQRPAKAKNEGNLIGLITHYFPHVQAAVIKLKAPLSIGETIKVKGHTTDLVQAVTSMQMDRVTISSAKKGMEIGVQVSSRVRHGDKVYKG